MGRVAGFAAVFKLWNAFHCSQNENHWGFLHTQRTAWQWPISVQNLRSSAKKIHTNFVEEALVVSSARWGEGDWRSHGSAAGPRRDVGLLSTCNPKPCLLTQNLQTPQAQQSSTASVQSMLEPHLKCGSELNSPVRKYLRTSPPRWAETQGQCHPLHLCDQDLCEQQPKLSSLIAIFWQARGSWCLVGCRSRVTQRYIQAAEVQRWAKDVTTNG